MSGMFAGSGALTALGSLFIKVLNVSIAAGWIVLAAALLRKLLKRAPKWAVCLMWLVLALRLVLPVSIESPFSLVPSAETVVVTEREVSGGSGSQYSQAGNTSQGGTDASQGAVDVQIHSGFDALNSYVNPIISGAAGSDNAEQSGTEVLPGSPAGPSAGAGQAGQAARSAGFASLIDTLGIVWAAGVAILLVYAAVSWFRLRRKVRASMPWTGETTGSGCAASVQNLSHRLRVFVCDDIETPFILGLFQPAVYLPSGLPAAETEHILSHEQAHITRRDHLWKPLGFALLAVYWFNPLMWLAYVLFCRDIELACDEKVVRAMDDGSKAAYSRTLVSCSRRQRLVTACPLAFGETGTGERVKSILSYRRPAFWIITLAIIVCIVLAVCFLTDPRSGGSSPKGGSRVQGQVYAWFDSITCTGGTGYENDVVEMANGTEVSIPDFPDLTFITNTKGIYIQSKDSITLAIGDGMPIMNAFFCDINGDGKPELCTSSCFGSGFVDQRIKVYDIANSKLYELSDRGNFDYCLVEKDGWLIVWQRAFEKYSSVGSDSRLTMEKGELAFAPLTDEKRTMIKLQMRQNSSQSDLPVSIAEVTGTLYNYSALTVTINGKTYYADSSTSYLPFGFTSIGRVYKSQPWDKYYSEAMYYMAEGRDDIYVDSSLFPDLSGRAAGNGKVYTHMVTTTERYVIQRLTLALVMYFAEQDELKRDIFENFTNLASAPSAGENYTIDIDGIYLVFVRFDASGKADIFNLIHKGSVVVDMLREDPKPYIDAHYVVDIIDTAEVHATALEKFWEYDGLEFWFPSIQSESMYVVTADGSKTPLKTALSEGLILVTDIPRFGFKVYVRGLYEGELTGLIPDVARLAQLKAHLPQFFGIDSSKGLMIYVYSLAAQHYSCGILPGDAQGVDLFGSSQSGSLTRDDVLLILKSAYPDVPDSKITVRPYYNPVSSYAVLDTDAYKKDLKALFGGRFEVGDPIGTKF